jgi:transcriptional regulator with XRE-family HTH domain
VAAKRPTERDLELGRLLLNARKAAGFDRQADVAERIDRSQATIARIENGGKHPTAHELTALLDLYQPANRREIEQLASQVDGSGLTLHPNFEALLIAEERAVAIRVLTGERIPMPLQCERYVLKQYNLADPSMATDVLRLHARRIDLLKRAQGPSFDALMSVSSLLRMPGGQADLVKEQAQHLLGLLGSAPRLTVRVLMFDADIPYLDSDFTLVTKHGRRAEVLYVPFGRDGHKITDKDKIKERESYWNLVRDAALSADETGDLLRDLAKHGHSAATGRIPPRVEQDEILRLTDPESH